MSIDLHIIQVISKEKVVSQEQLAEILHSKYKHEIDQSSLSRKLKKLKIAKKSGFYQQIKQEYIHLQGSIRDIFICEPNLIIIKTMPGMASAIGYVIDQFAETKEMSSIVGNVAGDDTIFIAISPISDLKRIKQELDIRLK